MIHIFEKYQRLPAKVLSVKAVIPYIPAHISPARLNIKGYKKCQSEPENAHDKYAIKVMKNQTIVGHVPRELSKYCSALINSDGQNVGYCIGKEGK